MNGQTILQILLSSPNVIKLIEILTPLQSSFRFVGGCIRDLWIDNKLDIQQADIDLATSLSPEQVIEILNQKNIQFITAGIKHGTIGVLVNQQIFEITSLRIDKFCDGRHAEVEFTDNWQLDASRRDFTINALYLDFEGNLYDYYNGIDNLHDKIVRFIGNPQTRIDEDYLRILRFVRFYLRYSNPSGEINLIPPDIKRIITLNASKLNLLSGERILQEIYKILYKSNIDSLIKILRDLNLEDHLGFKLSKFTKLKPDNNDNLIDEKFKLFLLIEGDTANIQNFINRCKLSNNLAKFLTTLDKLLNLNLSINHMLYFYGKELTYYYYIYKQMISTNDFTHQLKLIVEYTSQKFPISGKDLLDSGKFLGPEIAIKLRELELLWIDSDFTLTKPKLLELL